MKSIFFYCAVVCVCLSGCRRSDQEVQQSSVDSTFQEKHRPQIHFSPEKNWMNDPNGLVYVNGEYHFFYQYYPEAMVWGPMHWGHAVSKDLVHWKHLPIALYPDSLGLIFSGSAVLDKSNTSGLGSIDSPPLVAIFTYHSVEKQEAGRTDYEYQGIAYSTDNGKTWTKYDKNPVLPNQGVNDFRDPKVFFHTPTNRWIMTLAVKDHIEFWASFNLKEWEKLTDFGLDYGSHGGVWECPDLFEMKVEGESSSKWILIVNINPGGPNGGSATQYFIGDFDGKTFTPNTNKDDVKWLDYGPDNYAGVTWSNAPDGRRIFIGWMSNWAYATAVPTNPWRSAATVPRDLKLQRVNGNLIVQSVVAPELSSIAGTSKTFESLEVSDTLKLSDAGNIRYSIVTGTVEAKDFAIQLSNQKGQRVSVGYDVEANLFFVNRANSGDTSFSKSYPTEVYAPRFSASPTIRFTMVTDVASVEVFFDDGLSVMTAIFFPDEPLTDLALSGNEVSVQEMSITELKSIWRHNRNGRDLIDRSTP
jgi:fructan beta-fructosidase